MKERKEEYAATYKLGNTTVHIVAPPPMTDKEKKKVEDEIRSAIWCIIEESEGKTKKDVK